MLMTNSPSPRLPTWLRACLLAALLPGLAACKGSSADISGTGSPKAAVVSGEVDVRLHDTHPKRPQHRLTRLQQRRPPLGRRRQTHRPDIVAAVVVAVAGVCRQAAQAAIVREKPHLLSRRAGEVRAAEPVRVVGEAACEVLTEAWLETDASGATRNATGVGLIAGYNVPLDSDVCRHARLHLVASQATYMPYTAVNEVRARVDEDGRVQRMDITLANGTVAVVRNDTGFRVTGTVDGAEIDELHDLPPGTRLTAQSWGLEAFHDRNYVQLEDDGTLEVASKSISYWPSFSVQAGTSTVRSTGGLEPVAWLGTKTFVRTFTSETEGMPGAMKVQFDSNGHLHRAELPSQMGTMIIERVE